MILFLNNGSNSLGTFRSISSMENGETFE